jgi:hypothetical protein
MERRGAIAESQSSPPANGESELLFKFMSLGTVRQDIAREHFKNCISFGLGNPRLSKRDLTTLSHV